MSKEEICHYPPIIDGTDNQYLVPDMSKVFEIYRHTGFPLTPEGCHTSTAFLRGSTAAYLPEDGEILFRHPASDIDIAAITSHSDRFPGSGYHISFHRVDGHPAARETHVVFITPERISKDIDSRYHSFLLTKFAPPGWPIMNHQIHESIRAEALAALLVRGASRNQTQLVTPSGAARLILEECLYSEPWRWQSFRTYFVHSPRYMRQRRQLLDAGMQSLTLLAKVDRATKLPSQPAYTDEEVFQIKLDAGDRRTFQIERIRTLLFFVYDQLYILLRSDQRLSLGNFQRIMMKAQSLLANPFLRYDADLIFG